MAPIVGSMDRRESVALDVWCGCARASQGHPGLNQEMGISQGDCISGHLSPGEESTAAEMRHEVWAGVR